MLSCRSVETPLSYRVINSAVSKLGAPTSSLPVCQSMQQAAARRLSVIAASIINQRATPSSQTTLLIRNCTTGTQKQVNVVGSQKWHACIAPTKASNLRDTWQSGLNSQTRSLSSCLTCGSSAPGVAQSASMAGQSAPEADITYLGQEDAKAVDEELMGPLGFSVDQLMELAGLSVASAVFGVYRPAEHRRVLVLCGPGNNGGDGLVCARHLYHFGFTPTVCYYKRTDKPLYKGLVTQLEALHIPFVDPDNLSPPLTDHYDVIIDAMFGFSFKGMPRPPFDKLVKMLAVGPDADPMQSGIPPTVAIDIPSGWDVEQGDTENTGFHPQMLVSLTAPKLAAKFFRGPHHFLGGRFVPPAIVDKYNLRLPTYPGTAQCVRIGTSPLDVAAMRLSYEAGALNEDDVAGDPLDQFTRWFNDAVAANIHEPNGMSLATVNAAGRPSNRFVLLKGYDAEGFKWYTNYESRKGTDLSETGRASLAFWWPGLERQVRIEGDVEKLPSEESDAYFHSRPKGSQLGAAASPQSTVVSSRESLEEMYAKLESDYRDKELPRPETWGGFRLRPERIEFWQGRPSRLHDRLVYTKSDGGWKIERLAP